jgi:hypothetical protein
LKKLQVVKKKKKNKKNPHLKLKHATESLDVEKNFALQFLQKEF